MKELTARQGSILDFLRRHARERGYPPTIREIRDAFHLKSNRGVVDHLKALERKGYIRRVPGSSRGIEIENGSGLPDHGAPGSRGTIAYPVAGSIPAGRLEPPEGEAGGTLVLDDALFADRGDFILEVKGDGMIDDHIVPGDLIVVKKVKTCESGSLVAALVDGEATVKRLVRSGDHSRDCSIIGKVIGVIRSIPPLKKAFSD